MYLCYPNGSHVVNCEIFISTRRRNTRWSCDWSSDVCSSDLDPRDPTREQPDPEQSFPEQQEDENVRPPPEEFVVAVLEAERNEGAKDFGAVERRDREEVE